ncbi:protein NEDD1-like [Asterias rubens]|uniref:protein NEDD1-like n=1 Tax=Asterias rubens TaxID=7604 RepID=UPI001455669E|nr:protein NEDD1-like [Asterias rubens]XP_033647383.1 protein NEDD1-like [Asterias rubens]XP_033647384.1 protein NEDD1-like [Asterias rubens]
MEDGLKLASGGEDIKLWDVASSSTPSHQFSPHTSGISSLCWSHNNQILASAGSSGDKVVLTFVRSAASNIIELAEGEKQTSVSFNSTSRYLLSGGKNRIVSIWDLKSRKLKKTYTGHQDSVTCAIFNWNDTYIASGSASGEILLHNVVSGQASSPLIAPKTQSVRSLEYSLLKKSMLASVSDDGGLTMWDTNSRKPITTFRDAHRAPATGLAFSPVNDMLLMSTGLDKRIVCYDVLGKGIIRSMTVESPLTSIACMHDGATLAVGSTRGKVYIFDLRMGSTPLNVFSAHKSSVQSVRFQHAPTARSNGVGSKGAKPVQSVSAGRKLPQVSPGVAQVAPSIQKISKSSTNPSSGAGKSLEEAGNDSNRLGTPRDNIENQDIISPIREGARITDNVNHVGRPNTMGKADGTPATQKKDSLPDFFSPLSENTSNISSRRTPIGSVDLEPQSSPGVLPESATKSFPLDVDLYNGTSVTSSSNAIKSVRSNSSSSQPAITKPVLNLDRKSSPERGRSKSLTSQAALLPGLVSPVSGPELSLSPKEPVRLAVTAQPATVALTSPRTARTTGVTESDAKPFGTPQSRRTTSPGRGLLGGSSESASRAKSGDAISRGLVSASGSPRNLQVDYRDANNGAVAGADLQPFQVQFIKNMIDESLEDFKESFHREILHLQREMVRQFQIQQIEMQATLEKYSVNEGLLAELERLREENKSLKAKY